MSKKLSVDQTYKFVTLYKERRCLWDIKSKNYKNKRLREIALKQICKEMGIDNFHVEDVKTKIKSIRSTYYLELDKIKRSITSGYSNGKVYESKIKWFAELDSFIRKVMVKRKTDVSQFLIIFIISYFINVNTYVYINVSCCFAISFPSLTK